MTISNFCSEALGTFKSSENRNAEDFKGKRMGLDLSIFMNKFLFTYIYKLATTSKPAYPAPDLLQNIKNIYTNISRYIALVYVFDRIAPPHKKATKQKCLQIRKKNGNVWFKHHRHAIENKCLK